MKYRCFFFSPDVLCFDNTYSFLQSKKVSYNAEVLPPLDGQIPTQRGPAPV